MNQPPYSPPGQPQARPNQEPRPAPSAYPGGPESVVDQNSDFNGRYQTNNNLRVEGRAQGEIRCSGTLLIAEQGKVAATVQAQNVTIAGEYSGDIQCEGRFILLPTARANGRVRAGSLIIQEGAAFTGEIRMHDPNAPAARPAPAASSARSSRSERATPSNSGANGGFSGLLDEPPANGSRAGNEASSRTD